jgi:hypothetical protein
VVSHFPVCPCRPVMAELRELFEQYPRPSVKFLRFVRISIQNCGTVPL